ncbi:MAG TPA: hypothetical protein PLZ55_19925, partial [bacterium]|nr:hypothetical protein [bacterium]
MRVLQQIFICAFVMAHLLSIPQAVHCGIIYVSLNASGNGSGTSWENACTSISKALISSVTNDEIWVAVGRYMEGVEMKPGVSIYGGFAGIEERRQARDWEANETIIDATGSSEVGVTGADDGILDGFTVTGAYGGIYCDGSSPTINNCRIAGNTTPASVTGGGGVDCERGSPILNNCTSTG